MTRRLNDLANEIWKSIIVFVIIIAPFSACKSPVAYKNVECPCGLTFFPEEGKTFYDSIALPRLLGDSVKLYADLEQLLKFSDKLKWDGGIESTVFSLKIDVTGKSQLSGHVRSSPGVEKDMQNVVIYMLDYLHKWQPAFHKKDTSMKVPIWVNVNFFFYKDQVKFSVDDEMDDYYGFHFLRKAYCRPISRKRQTCF